MKSNINKETLEKLGFTYEPIGHNDFGLIGSYVDTNGIEVNWYTDNTYGVPYGSEGYTMELNNIEDLIALRNLLTGQAVSATTLLKEEGKPSEYQTRVKDWMLACFGEEISNDKMERNHRFLEEALELVQSLGCTKHEAMQLVDYVYDRPIGEPYQEVGGVMVTLAALCLANGLDMQADGETELARIWTKVERIREKQANKPNHSPLPQQPLTASLSPQKEWQDEIEAVRIERDKCDSNSEMWIRYNAIIKHYERLQQRYYIQRKDTAVADKGQEWTLKVLNAAEEEARLHFNPMYSKDANTACQICFKNGAEWAKSYLKGE